MAITRAARRAAGPSVSLELGLPDTKRTRKPKNPVRTGGCLARGKPPNGASKDQSSQTSPRQAGRRLRDQSTQTSPRQPGRGDRGSTPPAAGSVVESGRIVKRFRPELRSRPSKLLKWEKNRCYRDSLLQCLFHIPAMVQFLEDVHKDCSKRVEQCVVCALKKMGNAYWSDAPQNMRPIRPNESMLPTSIADLFHAACEADSPPGYLAEDFEFGRQVDANEFAIHLLGRIRDMDGGIAAPAWSEMFEVKQQTTWQCADCEQSFLMGSGAEASLGLIVPLGDSGIDPLHLAECLRNNMTGVLQQINCSSNQCQDNKQKMNQVQSIKLTQIPKILILQLGRTGYDNNKGGLYKDSRTVRYNEYINIGPHMEDDSEDHVYRLDGVVAHSGTSLDNGHYVALVRGADNKTFRLINDCPMNMSSSTSFNDIMEDSLRSRGNNFDAYILFYSKI